MQIPNLRGLRELHGLTQKELADVSGVSLRSVAGYEGGAHARPNTARKLAQALNVEVADLVGVGSYPKAQAPPWQQPPLNGLLAEERRFSRFSEAIIAAAAKWGEAMSNPDMDDRERFGLIKAALDLSGVIAEPVEEEDWEAIPNQERLAIVTSMDKLIEAASVGIRHLQESVQQSREAREQEEEAKQRREQIREWSRGEISA